jgi:glycine/D-amino acid oxidase-like deaminating enzyme
VEEPLSPRAPLGADLQCDVAIVGAGFTGLWAAYYICRAQPDARIVVLEAEIAGFGASGRNGGWAAAGIAGSASVYARRSGAQSVARAAAATCEAVDEVGRVAREEGIECGFLKAGALRVATTAPQEQRLLALARAREDRMQAPYEYQLLTRAEAEDLVRVNGIRAALHAPHAARIDPARLVRGLARAVTRRGVRIYEQTPVLDISPRRVRCATGVVSAEVVVRATESYTGALPGARRTYLPLYSQMIATEPLDSSIWGALGWRPGLLVSDERHLFFYAQRTPDDRVALGGRGAPYRLGSAMDPRSERSDSVRNRLRQALRTHFPAAGDAEITHHWGGSLAVPRDWSMGIDFDRATGIAWAGGYSGHGVIAANIAGRTLADLIRRADSDLVSLPWVGHRPRRWEPEPLRYIASSAIVRVLESADGVEDRTGRRARRVSLVSPFLPPG